jgi:hypothetical protein
MTHRTTHTVSTALVVAALTVASLTAAAPAPDGDHCAIGTEPMVSGEAQPAAVDCFATDEEMWRFLTGEPLEQQQITDGAVLEFNADIAHSSARLSADDVELDLAVTAAASVVLGYEYDGSGYSGTSLTLYASSGSGCSTGSTYGFPNLGSYGWNDRTSSATSYAGCRGQHYQNISYGGTSVTCSTACSSMGTLNNATSSIVYRP